MGNDYEISGTVITMAMPPAVTDLLLIDSYSGWGVEMGTLTQYYQDLVEGRILGRVTGGSAVLEFGSDSLGSSTSSRDGSTGDLQNTYRYKPYGQALSTTGSGISSPFLFVGSAGYDSIGRLFASTSLPQRMYDANTGRFISADPISFTLCWRHFRR